MHSATCGTAKSVNTSSARVKRSPLQLGYLTRIEQRINTGLVRKSKQGVYYAKFNAGALLRGDMKSRFEAYATGINWGIYSPNDCRDLEDMNPRPGGDVYLTPMNMTTKPSDGCKAGKQKDNANADETTS